MLAKLFVVVVASVKKWEWRKIWSEERAPEPIWARPDGPFELSTSVITLVDVHQFKLALSKRS